VLTDVGLPADIESIVVDDDGDDDQTYKVSIKETDIAHTRTPQFASSQPSYDDYGIVHTQPFQSDFVDAFHPPSQVCLFALHLTLLFGLYYLH
jgi:hypothetical protein